MNKSDVLIIRIEPETKSRLAEAASKSGRTITTIVTAAIDAALRKSAAARPPKQVPARRSGSPSFFRALCESATTGGASGYEIAGAHLALHVAGVLGSDLSDSEVSEQIDVLKACLAREDDEAALAWFDEQLPGCMALVPRRRRDQFLRGVHACDEERGISA